MSFLEFPSRFISRRAFFDFSWSFPGYSPLFLFVRISFSVFSKNSFTGPSKYPFKNLFRKSFRSCFLDCFRNSYQDSFENSFQYFFRHFVQDTFKNFFRNFFRIALHYSVRKYRILLQLHPIFFSELLQGLFQGFLLAFFVW